MPKRKKTFLQLRRKQGEKVIIGDPPGHITLKVGPTTSRGTELEFLAPQSVAIDREEIAQKKGRLGKPDSA